MELNNNFSPPENIGDLGVLATRAATDHVAATTLHQKLKALKTGDLPLTAQNSSQNNSAATSTTTPPQVFQVSWNEHQQRFTAEEAPPSRANSSASVTVQPPTVHTKESIENMLNAYIQRDKELRRADRYSLTEQDPSNLLQNLVASQHTASVTVAGNGTLLCVTPNNTSSASSANTSLSPSSVAIASPPGQKYPLAKSSAAPLIPSVSTTATSSPNSSQPILLYGFDGPRKTMKDGLIKTFPNLKLTTMNDYNACIGIGTSFNFEHYCNLIQQAKTGPLNNRIIHNIVTRKNTSSNGALDAEKVTAWCAFIRNHPQEFSFFKKLQTPQDRARFVAKNFFAISQETKGLSLELKQACRDHNWALILHQINPALDLLADTGAHIRSKEPFNQAELEARYNALTPDQKIVLNSILSRAFLRKTSKLGLSFAKAQNMTVFMAWQLPHYFTVTVHSPSAPITTSAATAPQPLSYASATTALRPPPPTITPIPSNSREAFHHYTEVKPYKVPEFRTIPSSSGSPTLDVESITSSEKRQLGRLALKDGAPQYSLIIPIDPASAYSSPQKGNSSTGKTAGYQTQSPFSPPGKFQGKPPGKK